MPFPLVDLIIPSYQPTEALQQLVTELSSLEFHRIIVVDDGSDKAKKNIFDQLAAMRGVVILNHERNKGKGESLKTGMQWILNNDCKDLLGIITVDADGQHLPKDVARIAAALEKNPHDYTLGFRTFDKNVPLRSRFGNTLTRKLFYWRYNVQLQDTQTGLRAVPWALIPLFLTLPYPKYEYEMACLIAAIQAGCQLQQIPVETVYIDHNVSSHFHPVLDSMRIYGLFFRCAFMKGKKFGAQDVANFKQ